MNHGPCTVWLLVFMLAAAPFAQARSEVRGLKWSELGAAVANRRVTLVLSTNARLQGTVAALQQDALLMDIIATSDKQAYPAGQTSVPRKDVVQVRIKKVKGPARLVGAAGIGAAASLGSLAWAISERRINVSDASRITSWIAITIGAVIGGYFIGRAIDTRETIINVLPGD